MAKFSVQLKEILQKKAGNWIGRISAPIKYGRTIILPLDPEDNSVLNLWETSFFGAQVKTHRSRGIGCCIG